MVVCPVLHVLFAMLEVCLLKGRHIVAKSYQKYVRYVPEDIQPLVVL